jgi:hypothetical protein
MYGTSHQGGRRQSEKRNWFLGICLDLGFGMTVHTTRAQRFELLLAVGPSSGHFSSQRPPSEPSCLGDRNEVA